MPRLLTIQRAVAASLILAAAAAPLAAQGPSDKAMMKADWERAKRTFIAYVDAMPDSALGFMPTPGVRTFAQQIEHAVVTNYEVATAALRGERPKMPGDSTAYLHRKDALRELVTRTYDSVLSAIDAATPAQLAKPIALFNQPAAPASRWMQLSYEHATWTLGQTIPYLRLNKVTPPDYQIPF
jgi:hypothetical protein